MPRMGNELRRRLFNALLDAFPDEDNLQELVVFGLNENLAAIAGSGPLRDLVLQLIVWAEAQDRLEELIWAALQERPRNSELQSIAAQLGITAGTGSGPVLPLQAARLVIARDQSLMGVGMTIRVYVDEEERGSLRNNQSLTIELSPGSHRLQVMASILVQSAVLLLTLRAGEEAQFICHVGFGGPTLQKL